jgi:predicted O-methyltransferase YrrM
VRVLRDRGVLVVANTLSHAKDLVEFSELVYAAEDMTSTLLTVGAGVLLVVKSP